MAEVSLFLPDAIEDALLRDLADGLRQIATALDDGQLDGRFLSCTPVGSGLYKPIRFPQLFGSVRREHANHPAARALPCSHSYGRVFDHDAIAWTAGEQCRSPSIALGVGLAFDDMVARHNLRRCRDAR